MYCNVKLETMDGFPPRYIVTAFDENNKMTLLYAGFNKIKAKKIYKKSIKG